MSKNNFQVVEYGETGKGCSLAVASMEVSYDKGKNLEKYDRFIQVSHERKVDLLVFPEMSLQGYLWSHDPAWCLPRETAQYHWEQAETVPGPASEWMARKAKETGMRFIFGLGRRGFHQGKGVEMLYNSAALVGPEGVIGVYDKVHNPGGEKHIFKGGREMPVFQTPFGKIGMMICYDAAFPEASRILALKGADILVLPTAWGAGDRIELKNRVVENFGHLAYQSFIRARALENHAWFLSANWTGLDNRSGFNFLGGSAIINPLGITLAEVQQEGLAIAHGLDIPGERLAAKTDLFFGNNLFLDRRPELYGPLTEID